jgi:hypothetical protein
MSKQLKMPSKGQSAAMMAALQAEHASAPEENEATNVTTLQPDNAPTNDTTDVAKTPEPSPAQAPATPAPPEPSAPRNTRLAFARERAASDEISVVTVRVPAVLNRYMDDYVARINRLEPKRKYRKQDAVLEAFAAFYADHPLPPAPNDENLA